MSKQAKRKITVNISPKNKTLPKARPSVFERLGTKAGSAHKEVCHHWAQHGTCPYGKGCKYSSTHTLISPSKQRLAKKENESKKRHSKEGTHKRLHSSNLKSTQSPEEEWNQWDPTELEDADPDDLEKRRQELQRELELQMKMESKARKKEKKLKRESSPSTESSSSSSDSSTSSDESSSTSSSSVDTTRRKKIKKVKVKQRESSSSTDRERTRKHKPKSSKHSAVPQPKPVIKITTKSPTPVRTSKKSQTPPPKLKTFIPVKKDSSRSKSPRPPSSTSDHKEKHRTPSPKTSKDKEKEKEREKEKTARDREREKEKEREREKEKEREREKEKEREREREKEKEREREREKEREREREKAREREKEREKEKEQKKRDTRSPRRDTKLPKDTKRKESPESRHSRDRKLSPSRSRGSGSGSSRRDNSRKNSPTACKDGRRADKREDHDRSRGKERVNDKNRKEKRDSRDRDRDRDRERRIAREEKEAKREKEREEALARCQERQRERERLKELAKNKELAKKEEERRNKERSRRVEDRGLDKPSGDRVERLLPLPADRIPPTRRGRSPEKERSDRDRTRDGHRDRTPDRNRSGTRKSVDRHERLERDVDRIEHVDRERSERIYDRGYERSERSYDRDPERDRERDRDYPSLTSRLRDSERRHDEKSYDSPYERSRHEDRRYLDLEDRYNESSRDDRISIDARDYPDDRRSHREMWDVREDRDVERDREIDQRRYGREDSRPPSLKGRDWDAVDYPDHEWDRGRRPLDWEGRGAWDSRDHEHSQLDDEWRHYNRSMDSWAADDRRRWPEWRDRSRPRSAASHREEEVVDVHKRELPKPDSNDSSQQEVESKKDIVLGKRVAEQPLEGVVDAKKPCVKEPPLEDDLSEISDDADEILNREEELPETQIEENLSADSATKSSEKEAQEVQPPPVSASSQKSQSPNRTPNRLTKEESMDDENMDLDFEEISEDELEEETRVKGLGDALGVDWASLVAESRPRVKPVCSAKRRWESHNILINLGISVEMAGEDIVKDVMVEHAQAKSLEEKEETLKNSASNEHIKREENSNEIAFQVKQEPTEISTDSNTDIPISVQVKEEKIDGQLLDVKQEISEIQISHPVAAIQVALREKEAIRKSLFASAGPYRRALSARRDLAIRRHLCNLPIKDTYVEAPKRHDPELLKQALQLFERSL